MPQSIRKIEREDLFPLRCGRVNKRLADFVLGPDIKAARKIEPGVLEVAKPDADGEKTTVMRLTFYEGRVAKLEKEGQVVWYRADREARDQDSVSQQIDSKEE